MKEPKPISYDEVMKNLEKFAKRVGGNNGYQFTPKMDALILRGREKNLSFDTMSKLWKQLGWASIAPSTIRRRYYNLKENPGT